GIRGQRDVDALLEEEPSDGVDVLVTGERNLDDRKARLVRRVDAEAIEAAEHGLGLLPEACPDLVAAKVVEVEPRDDRCERSRRGRARVQVRRSRGPQQALQLR